MSRKYGNQPAVIDDAGEVSHHQPKDLLPGIELYGQNEIYEMIRDEQSRNQLIERFLEGEHEHFDTDIAKVLARLKENRESIECALSQKGDIEAEVERLPKLKDQAKQFQVLGIDEQLKVIPKLEKEKQLNGRVNEEVDRVKEAIETLKESLPDTVFLSEASLERLPHAGLLKQQREIVEGFKAVLTQTVTHGEQEAKFRPIEDLSTGQQCTAILHLYPSDFKRLVGDKTTKPHELSALSDWGEWVPSTPQHLEIRRVYCFWITKIH